MNERTKKGWMIVQQTHDDDDDNIHLVAQNNNDCLSGTFIDKWKKNQQPNRCWLWWWWWWQYWIDEWIIHFEISDNLLSLKLLFRICWNNNDDDDDDDD